MKSNKVGILIQKLRKENKLTQQKLADLLGVSPKTISKWETGTGLPDISFLRRICEIFNITIDELLEGKLNEQKEKNINNNKKITIALMIGVLILLSILIPIVNYKNKITEETNSCTIVRTYYIDKIGKSNDENYLYITVHEYQKEGTYTLKLPKIISENLEVGNSYEFTFKTSEKYKITTTDDLFNNSEVINIEYTDKIGNEQTSTYYCN